MLLLQEKPLLSPMPLPGIKRRQMAWKATILPRHYYADGLVFLNPLKLGPCDR